MSDVLYALARVGLSLVFIVSGVFKFMNVAGIAKNAGVTKFLATIGMPDLAVPLGYLIATIEVAGGLMILLGFKAAIAAVVLIVFTLLTIYYGHPFWDVPADQVVAQRTQALKNLAMIGGLLLLVVHGSGPLSFDRRGSSA
jgi:putative oxidoreductase